MKSIEELLVAHARRTPDKVAVMARRASATYRELLARSQAVATIYARLGLTAGDRIILAADKELEFVYAYFGAHLAGITVTPLDARTNDARLQYIIGALEPGIVIGFAPEMTCGVRTLALRELGEMLVATDTSGASALADENLADQAADYQLPAPTTVADILFTTGTTGEPKGVELTVGNVAAAARNINTFIGNGSEDIEVLALPISHSFGLGRIRASIAAGATIYLLGSFANVKKLYRVLAETRATIFTMVPASYRYLVQLSGARLGEFADQLKYIELGSAYLAHEEKQALADLLPHTRICMHYGLTEASRSTFMEFHEDSARLDSVGRPSPYTEVAVFSPAGVRLADGECGEIAVRGEHVTHGYYRRDASGDFYGEYFRTGDYGYTQDGYIYLVGRYKELINVGGKKVSPVEVEEVLRALPAVADCACVAAPDPSGLLGEVVKAFIVWEKGAPTDLAPLRAAVSASLEGYKVPQLWERVDAIPRTQNGKIQRLKLK